MKPHTLRFRFLDPLVKALDGQFDHLMLHNRYTHVHNYARILMPQVLAHETKRMKGWGKCQKPVTSVATLHTRRPCPPSRHSGYEVAKWLMGIPTLKTRLQ